MRTSVSFRSLLYPCCDSSNLVPRIDEVPHLKDAALAIGVLFSVSTAIQLYGLYAASAVSPQCYHLRVFPGLIPTFALDSVAKDRSNETLSTWVHPIHTHCRRWWSRPNRHPLHPEGKHRIAPLCSRPHPHHTPRLESTYKCV